MRGSPGPRFYATNKTLNQNEGPASVTFEGALTSNPVQDGDSNTASARFPIRTSVKGVDAIVIPTIEYLELLRMRADHLESRNQCTKIMEIMRLEGGMLSPIWQDIEVMEYLVEHLARHQLHAVFSACLDRFGPDRTPSRSALHRFRQKLRNAHRDALRSGI